MTCLFFGLHFCLGWEQIHVHKNELWLDESIKPTHQACIDLLISEEFREAHNVPLNLRAQLLAMWHHCDTILNVGTAYRILNLPGSQHQGPKMSNFKKTFYPLWTIGNIFSWIFWVEWCHLWGILSRHWENKGNQRWGLFLKVNFTQCQPSWKRQ